MLCGRIISVLTFCLGLIAAPVLAQRSEEVSEVVPADGATDLEVSIDFGAGDLEIRGDDIEDAARLDIYYSPRYVRYDVDYVKRGSTGRLLLESKYRDRGHDVDDVDNEWRLVLSEKYPLVLDIDLGASESTLDLGGLRITDLDIDIGASSGVVEFSRPNPERLRDLTIDCGASSLKVRNLGNANADRIRCDVGASSCDFDFGDLTADCELNIDVGVGSAEIVVPRGLAVSLEGDDGWFSEFDFHGLDLEEVRDGLWETPDFDKASIHLSIRASVAMGSIELRAAR